MDTEVVSVALLGDGEEGIVQFISGGKSLTSRLAGIGIVSSVRIKVLRRSGGLVIVQAADTRLVLGAGEASKIMVNRVLPLQEGKEQQTFRRKLLVTLTGQPNVGKSTVFNILTGLSQHIGNWPGKTVEKKEGAYVSEDVVMQIIDLPGTYSLTAFSEEERIARDFIINVSPDVIVLLVNASALERSLYLLSELLLLDSPIIVAVNMIDVAEDQGIHIDVRALQKSLGIPVVSMIATKNRGIKELVSKIIEMARGETDYRPKIPGVSRDHQDIFEKLLSIIRNHVHPPYTPRWMATKLMEGDPEISGLMESAVPGDVWNEIQVLLAKHEDSLHAVVGGRYDWIEEVTRAAISRFKMGQVVMTDRIDHVLTRPILGIPVLLAVFAAIFSLTYKIGFPLQEWLESQISSFAGWLDGTVGFSNAWLRGIIIDGVIGGVGSVLTFLPILIIFFTAMAVLEDVGYMARAAFVMDRFMHLVGLHGKSFLPLCLGFGCNVPSVLVARIVESKKERLLTIFLAPFVPCTARLAVLTFVAAAMFLEKATIVSWSLLTVNILALGVTGMLVNKFFLKDEPTPFIMELPLYHKPDFRTISVVVWTRTVAFIRKAGTVILCVSILVWVLSYLPHGNVENSVLAWIGHRLEFIGRPLGFDWKMITALLTSIVAKENAIATLGVLHSVGEQGLIQVLPTVVSHASALAFLVVMMLFVPCAATVAVMRKEMGGGKWFISSLLVMLVVSFIGGIAAYNLALWIGL
ncbi:MAG: ferrous iron transport protein B [Deltaproteobacteria bacterium]|nr:ferrous iron transport protein B [Deltaproteobacteria bacterium]